MKAFFIGIIFLIAVIVLAGLGILLFPLMLVLGFLLRVALGLFFVIFLIYKRG